jgi:heptosyltransferase-2
VILAPNWLGDAVMALPAVADVRRHWPDTRLAVAARGGLAPLYRAVPGIDGIIALDSPPARLSVGRDPRRLSGARAEIALLLPNAFRAAYAAWRAGIPERWGYGRDLRARLLTRALPRPKGDVHQAEYYQALATGLGLATGDRYARLEVSEDDRRRARALLVEAGIEEPSQAVVFAPGAAYGRAKQWLPQRFAELARMLIERGFSIVLVGAGADASACRDVYDSAASAGRPRIVDLAGKTDLTALAGLLQQAHAVVANDSGAMHLAAAVGAKVVALFGPTNDRQTSPLGAGPDAPAPIVVSTDVWCRPCMLRECPIDHRCMTGITAQRVFDAVMGRTV